MTIHVAIHHKTEYRFDRPVEIMPHTVRLRPAPHCRTPISSYSLKVMPQDHFVNWQQDPFGNFLARYVFPERSKQLSIDVELIAEMTVVNPFDFFLEESAEHFPFQYDAHLAKDLAPYLEVKEQGPKLLAWLAKVDRSSMRIVDFLVQLNGRLQHDIDYIVRMETGVQRCEETLALGRGSCRDSSWLLVQILRQLGLAARFASGYLVQLVADVKSLDGPSGPTEDFTDLHAWAEVYIPGAGWIGLDPTSGLFAGEGHIPLACTPNPLSAAPVTGGTERCEVEFYFHNRIERIHEDPRVTKPYTEKQWQAITELGQHIDKQLQSEDVRLTMGGEPTFVSIDDMDGAQWNTEALGEKKLELANVLAIRLQERFATDGVLHYGQGKWYPGEPLPRWALNIFWRSDEKPLWKQQKLLAKQCQQGQTVEDAKAFAKVLCGLLGLSEERLIPAFEDVFYYLWKEGTLPSNVDPFDSHLQDEQERARIRQIFEAGLDTVAGYVLPLEFHPATARWRSSPWPLRRERLYLVPGDSPMGLRLPLDSLPWVAPGDTEQEVEPDPFEERPALDEFDGEKAKHGNANDSSVDHGHRDDKETAAKKVIHTSLCVQNRDGQIYVFLPPIKRLEPFIELIGLIERAAKQLNLAIRLEGYEPPEDPRLRKLQVTPDPGVIEVNIHPAHSWDELSANTEILYKEAYLNRLATEKFMIDGRHTGTGGGNHVTFGGATPADSPVLRRPDLLRSLITYWQNHPSLSFLFSGAFVGPTSQAPRVDEARDDSLYELEIAFQQITKGVSPSPWIIDRLLRNLLVDMTGNTHRTEFCVDKLYSPEGPAGRRGLVEFRSFEMPPHPRMSLVQMLLLRATIAWFWQQPYQQRLVRWSTELHDRFMLPHFVWEDFKEVINDLQQAGYPLKPEWFAPFREFRFPHYGSVTVQGIELSIHWAIEPWHVLGEEVTTQGTSRYVDSSVERLQVKVRGLVGDRYIVACNGRRLPMRPAGPRGEYVAAVRYKAWQPPSGLHPALPAQKQLVFDIVDIANQRSIGGCTYHVSHPGGRHYDTFPVNANEAEARRNARFWPQGHSQGKMHPPQEEPAGDHPYTLDLRYRCAVRV